jgi:hypothetical protein
VVAELYESVLGPYWPKERKLVEGNYRDIDFPFPELQAPAFAMQQHWALPQLQAYLQSWSATQRYMRERRTDPVAAIAEELRRAWGDEMLRTVTWPLILRLGYRP